MLSDIMLGDVMLSVVMLLVILLSVVAPFILAAKSNSWPNVIKLFLNKIHF
jgi:hypothetical protein